MGRVESRTGAVGSRDATGSGMSDAHQAPKRTLSVAEKHDLTVAKVENFSRQPGLESRSRDAAGAMTTIYHFHPFANLFPLIEGPEFDDLVADVQEHGLRDEVVLFQGQVLDGRNRYRARV
jgi:hypothetical protein